METIKINVQKTETKKIQKILLGAVAPRPIALASTIDKNGNPNLSPFSFFNVFSANPPIAIFSPARRIRDNTTKHTLENIKETKEVVGDPNLSKKIDRRLERNLILYIAAIIILSCAL